MKPFTLIIFGATGDLARRKLMPALYRLYKAGLDFNIIGIGRRSFTDFFAFATEFMDSPEEGFKGIVSYFVADFENHGNICLIPEYLDRNIKENVICYLAVAPQFFTPIVQQLAECGFIRKRKKNVALVFEKPFGNDLASARKLNTVVRSLFSEERIYRVDHFLGKESVQNLMVLRFANQLFEQIWNRNFIEKVHIYAYETEGVGTRGGYYDKAGALKDMVQNHLMQILSLIAMEQPRSFDQEDVRNEKVKVVKALKLAGQPVRGQYVGYQSEQHIAKGSATETYVALKTAIKNDRWRGVPFIIETGKHLHRKETGVHVYFRPVQSIFSVPIHPNRMEINIQPKGDIDFFFNTKELGHDLKVKQVKMTFCTACEFGSLGMEAYEKLIFDIASHDQTLFTRADEIEASWKFIDRIAEKMKKTKLLSYPPGSLGPKK